MPLETPPDQPVVLYTCGPTVYGPAHVGNARPVLTTDVLRRVLDVTHDVVSLSNITDIDDKIIQRAAQDDVKPADIAARFHRQYRRDITMLDVMAPTKEPLATAYVPEMIHLITTLIERGRAYVHSDHVLYDSTQDAQYGHLSGRTPDEQVAGARVEVAPYKKSATDFVLWKPSTAEQPGWDSPWGFGRPGWHTECCAMIEALADIPIDIHLGGHDLLFPHHENEDAQSRASGHDRLARHWMHVGMVRMEGAKMARSQGNVLTIAEAVRRYTGPVVRWALLATHYRHPLNWQESSVKQARDSLTRLARRCAKRVNWGEEIASVSDLTSHEVYTALCDDLNTPAALSALTRMTQENAPLGVINAGLHLLGLPDVQTLTQTIGNADINIDEQFAQALNAPLLIPHRDALMIRWTNDWSYRVAERLEARDARNFELADALRDNLASQGIVLEDSGDGIRLAVDEAQLARVVEDQTPS